MAGRGNAPLSAGRRALKTEMDRLLRAAVRLDGIDPEVGERLRHAGAAALKAAVAQAIRSSESETARSDSARAY